MAPISKQCFFFIITLTCCQKIHMVKCSQRDSSAFLALQRSRLRRLAIGSERQDFHSTPSFMKVTGPQHFKSLPLLMSVSLSVWFFSVPTVSLPPSSYACLQGRCGSISRLQFLSRGRGHGKGLVITAGTLTASPPLSLLPSTFLRLPCPCLSSSHPLFGIFSSYLFLSSYLFFPLLSTFLERQHLCDDRRVSYGWGTNRKWPQ